MDRKHRLETLEQALGVRFADRNLLTLALVHSSYLNENPEDFPDQSPWLNTRGLVFG